MALTPQDIRKIANLARLHIDESEVEQYQHDLSRILEFVEQMNRVDVGDIEPMAHPQDLAQRLRIDQVTETDQRDKFQSIAPATQDGLYLVPKVIE